MHTKNLSLRSRLVVGFTASNLDSSLALLSDIADLPTACRPHALVICCDKVEAGHLRPRLDSFGKEKIKVVLVPKNEIANAALNGQFGEYYSDTGKQVGIAFHRTALHHYLYREAISLPNPVVWILDDDVRLEKSCFVEDPRTGESRLSETLTRMTEECVDIAIGKVCGDPPIPGASMVRTQLLDLDFNLRALRNPDYRVDYEKLEQQKMENARKYADYYYDLTLSHGGHLETPWYHASESGSTNRLLILEEMLRKVRLIEYGVNVFRPLPASAPANPDSNPILPTRGGNTFVLSPDCLREYPNIAPWIDGVPLRRGDTLWAILNKRLSSKGLVRKTASIDFPVLQDRRYCSASIAGIDVLLADILGGALTRAINQTLRIRNNAREATGGSDEERGFTTAEIKEIERIFEELTRERLALLLMNSWRIQGLVDSIRAQMDEILRQDGEEGAVVRKYVADVEGLLSLAQETFSPGAIAVLRTRALGYSKAELEDFLSNLESYSASYRSKLPTIEVQADPDEALSFLKDKFGDRRFELLAKGGEAVVFSDGTSVYKYFHHGVENFENGQLEFLQSNCSAERLGWAKRITPVERVLIDGHKVLFVSKLVAGHQYAGGLLSEVLELLRECRRAGIVLTNISPKNIVATDDSLTYVDIGRSVEPLEEDGYLEMCRRAYLVYRWHFKADLQELLRRAIHNDSLPEAFGFESFMAALRELDAHDLLDEPLLNLVTASKPRRILDYGCGNGGVADKLSQRGADVTAYDIDPTRYLQHPHKDNVELVDRERIDQLIASGSAFDAVLCSRVLCTIEGEAEIRQIVAELRKLVDHEGTVVVAICNPFGWQTQESETHIKQTPPTARYSNHFPYTKLVKVTRRSRVDYHRPLSWYLSTFRRAGLDVESLVETPGTDVQRLAPSGDLLLRLRPTSVPEKSDVSLLIKTCAMEWRTIRKQIEHLVGQLESPRLFREKVVLIDSYQGPFARQYDSADIRALMKVLDSLVEEGVIDRVLEAPAGEEWAAALNRRWFGLDAVASRAENGQPALATLYGFEKCRGEYVLHIDGDCLVGRPDLGSDYLQDMLDAFENDPDCVTVSLPVASRSRSPYTNGDGKTKWRTEVRCGIVSKSRLEKLLPLPNSVNPDRLLSLPWHRALDNRLRESPGQSYRGGGPGVFFVHVPNERKGDFNSWYNIMKAVEQGRLYEGQLGNVDLVGAVEDWLPRRSEEYVMVVRGRNVPAAKLRRCFDSLESQTDQEWGLVVVDAGSDNGMDEYIEEVVMRKYGARMTFYRNLVSAPPVANIYFSVRRLCDNPESVVLMPDADDAFLCSDAVAYIKREYTKGADFAIGGMMRSDKDVHYSSNFHEPRSSRGGNVWQPLRTFKKHLFERINPDDLKVDGDWVPHTEDWAFMLPMAEMAESPIQFDRMIYYYDPSSLKEELPKEEREALIARIVAKPRYGRADNA